MDTGRSVKADSDLGRIEQAVYRVVAWNTRNDVQQETFRRARCELSPRLVWLLASLDLLGRPARISDLAALLGVEVSTLTPQANRLERDGFIVRKADPADGRASLLRLTRSGKGVLTRIHTVQRIMLSELLTGWSAADQEQAAAVLTRLAKAVDASRMPPHLRVAKAVEDGSAAPVASPAVGESSDFILDTTVLSRREA